MSLIKEFAIEPRVMATWTHFSSLWEDFGVGRGRLISKYPVQWAQRVAELAKELSPPVRASAIASKIWAEQHKFILRVRTYKGSVNWLENAVAQMARNPFDAIIAEASPSGHPAVLVAGEFDKAAAPFYVDCQAKVERTAVALAQCATLLLRHCEEIRLVDPNFDPAEPRFVETFRAVLALRDPAASPLKVLEVHTERKPAFSRGNREHHLRRAFALEVPQGTTLRVCFWEQRPGGEKLHARFLLTEQGGLQYDYGLDEAGSGERTIVTLLQHSLWEQIRRDYANPSPTFHIGGDATIEIRGNG